MTVETAKAVLKTSSLRWRAPSQFNDPFDHQASIIFPFTQEEFGAAFSKAFKRLIYSDELQFNELTQLSFVIQMTRERLKHVPDTGLGEAVELGVTESADLLKIYKEQVNSEKSKVLAQSRVLCVTERNDNVVMWSHYADSHKGVCLKLNCVDDADNALLIAKKVQYTKDLSICINLEDHILHLTGERPIDYPSLIYTIPYRKHVDWEYEEEWRVHCPHVCDETGTGYCDWVEDRRVFGAMYLGCRIEPKDAAELIGIARQEYPHMKIFQVKQNIDKSVVEFEALS